MLLIMMKGGMYQLNILIYSIIVSHSRLLGCIDLVFLCLFERVIIKKKLYLL